VFGCSGGAVRVGELRSLGVDVAAEGDVLEDVVRVTVWVLLQSLV
jgi:hypothetical protein